MSYLLGISVKERSETESEIIVSIGCFLFVLFYFLSSMLVSKRGSEYRDL